MKQQLGNKCDNKKFKYLKYNRFFNGRVTLHFYGVLMLSLNAYF